MSYLLAFSSNYGKDRSCLSFGLAVSKAAYGRNHKCKETLFFFIKKIHLLKRIARQSLSERWKRGEGRKDHDAPKGE